MAINVTESSPPSFISGRSVIHCPRSSNFTWDLNETTIHLITLPVSFVASLATIVLNVMAVLAIQRKRELKKTSTILLSSMAIADLLVGAISMPLTVAADVLIIRQVYYSGFCTLRIATESSTFTFIWSSIYHLTLIAWERYIAIRKWIDYKVIVTRGRMKTLAVVAWLLAVFTSFPPLVMIVVGVDYHTKEAWHIGESAGAVVSLITIGYFYIMVYLGVRKRKIDEISQVTAIVKAKLESKVAMTTALITFALILSFVPVIVVGALREILPVLGTNKAFRVSEILIQLNSLANPLIYFYRDRRLRNAVLELLGVRRPKAIQPAVGTVRFVRRKNTFGSKGHVQELQKDEQHTRLKRAASCDLAVVSYNDHGGSREMFLKRSMSAPMLKKYGSSLDSPHHQQASFMAVKTALTHTKSDGRHQAKIRNCELPQDSIKRQDTSHAICNIPRSKSWDVSASVKCAKRTCKMLQETAVKRPTTAPLLHSEQNCSAKLMTNSGSSQQSFEKWRYPQNCE